jgi:hypothetical protein
MTKDEALKLALEAMEDVQDMMTTSDWFNERVQVVRQALAEPDTQNEREWVGLTDEEIEAIQYNSDTEVEYELFDEGDYGTEINIYPENFARAIEAKLKEKNT